MDLFIANEIGIMQGVYKIVRDFMGGSFPLYRIKKKGGEKEERPIIFLFSF